jgi:hypothetical protein
MTFTSRSTPMPHRSYLLVSGAVFAVVAALHLLRVVNGWNFVIGPWDLPMWVSWLGASGPGLLAAWAFRLAAVRSS